MEQLDEVRGGTGAMSRGCKPEKLLDDRVLRVQLQRLFLLVVHVNLCSTLTSKPLQFVCFHTASADAVTCRVRHSKLLLTFSVR